MRQFTCLMSDLLDDIVVTELLKSGSVVFPSDKFQTRRKNPCIWGIFESFEAFKGGVVISQPLM